MSEFSVLNFAICGSKSNQIRLKLLNCLQKSHAALKVSIHFVKNSRSIFPTYFQLKKIVKLENISTHEFVPSKFPICEMCTNFIWKYSLTLKKMISDSHFQDRVVVASVTIFSLRHPRRPHRSNFNANFRFGDGGVICRPFVLKKIKSVSKCNFYETQWEMQIFRRRLFS